MVSEKRLIEANALWKALDEAGLFESGNPRHIAQQTVEEQPTVEAVEVVHGKWVVCGDGEYVPFMCSVCGKTTVWYHAQTAKYCPNCGAKMEGKDNG